jgi:monoamine oxidase
LKDLHFLFTRDQIFPTFWTAMPLRVPILVAWAAGPLAEAKRHQSHHQIEGEALDGLGRILSIPQATVRSHFVRSFFHDWQADPHSQGAYSYVLVGGMGAQAELARPLRDKLFFAGEATQSDGHHATVHGAFASGRRVTEEVLQRLTPTR